MDESLQQRLLKLLDTEQLSSSRFADAIGVQRSSVSHILTGRNKPSFDFLQKTLRAFPILNADWLILGEGSMYEDEDRVISGTLFDQQAGGGEVKDSKPADDVQNPGVLTSSESNILQTTGTNADLTPTQEVQAETAVTGENVSVETPSAATTSPGKQVERIVLFYTDKTFDSFNPNA